MSMTATARLAGAGAASAAAASPIASGGAKRVVVVASSGCVGGSSSGSSRRAAMMGKRVAVGGARTSTVTPAAVGGCGAGRSGVQTTAEARGVRRRHRRGEQIGVSAARGRAKQTWFQEAEDNNAQNNVASADAAAAAAVAAAAEEKSAAPVVEGEEEKSEVITPAPAAAAAPEQPAAAEPQFRSSLFDDTAAAAAFAAADDAAAEEATAAPAITKDDFIAPTFNWDAVNAKAEVEAAAAAAAFSDESSEASAASDPFIPETLAAQPMMPLEQPTTAVALAAPTPMTSLASLAPAPEKQAESVRSFLYPGEDELPDDVNMSIWEHLDELRERALISSAAVAFAVLFCFCFAKDLVLFLELPVKEEGVRFLQLGGAVQVAFTVTIALKRLVSSTLEPIM
jgi:hypothetical protein